MIKFYLFKTFILLEKGTSNGTVTDVEGNYLSPPVKIRRLYFICGIHKPRNRCHYKPDMAIGFGLRNFAMDRANHGIGMTRNNRMNCNMLLHSQGQKGVIDGILSTSWTTPSWVIS